MPSLSIFGVTVSIPEALFSKVVLNSTTIYSPSGAPGRDVVYESLSLGRHSRLGLYKPRYVVKCQF